MARGFSDVGEFAPVIGWELDQVAFDKYHVMFQFYAKRLLNVAHSFAVRSPDGEVDLTYDIYGARKTAMVDPLLRQTIAEARIVAADRLDLVFDNGYILSVFDDPELRSWWFMSWGKQDATVPLPGDCEVEDLTAAQYRGKDIGGIGLDSSAKIRGSRKYVVRLKGDDT